MTKPNEPAAQASPSVATADSESGSAAVPCAADLIAEVERIEELKDGVDLPSLWIDDCGDRKGGVECREYVLACVNAFPTIAEAVRRGAELQARMNVMMPLFEEARDALCAISTTAAKLHNVRLDLADRMDDVGIPERWKALTDARKAQTSIYQYDGTTIKARYP